MFQNNFFAPAYFLFEILTFYSHYVNASAVLPTAALSNVFITPLLNKFLNRHSC